MIRGALACFVHAAFPGVCTTTGSQTVIRLYDRMVLSRANAPGDKNIVERRESTAEYI
jgi:hypothetical protein